MKKNALVIGGSNGIGLAFVKEMLNLNYNKIWIVDRVNPCVDDKRIIYINQDLTDCDFTIFDNIQDVNSVIITAGFGRISEFDTFSDKEIEKSFVVNSISIIKIINHYFDKLKSDENFNFAVMGSIAGLVSSPLFSVYSATKAALCRFIESVNIELEMAGTSNRILNISPGSLQGTRFNGGSNNVELLGSLVYEIINRMNNKETIFIPQYEEIYKNVIQRYYDNPNRFGIDSYKYKKKSGRINDIPQIKIGYLSGTFDLFHVGHLNLLRRAKQYCDYLVVGVHKDASHKGKETYIPFEQRLEIVKSVKYVDEAIMSKPEDIDVYDDIKYDYLFVGSDYKGTEKFNRYEEYFKDKNAQIIYFSYTKGVSSTELRANLDKEDVFMDEKQDIITSSY